MLKFLFSTLFISTTAFASGGGGHDVSVMDLIPPAINFFLLLGFLIYKIKGPLSNYFTEKANLVEETVERANIKAKEATSGRKIVPLGTNIDSILSGYVHHVIHTCTGCSDCFCFALSPQENTQRVVSLLLLLLITDHYWRFNFFFLALSSGDEGDSPSCPNGMTAMCIAHAPSATMRNFGSELSRGQDKDGCLSGVGGA